MRSTQPFRAQISMSDVAQLLVLQDFPSLGSRKQKWKLTAMQILHGDLSLLDLRKDPSV